MIIDLILLINKPKVLWPWRAIIFSAEVIKFQIEIEFTSNIT